MRLWPLLCESESGSLLAWVDRADGLVEAAVGLSVSVRWRPVGTAMNGTVVARPLGLGGIRTQRRAASLSKVVTANGL